MTGSTLIAVLVAALVAYRGTRLVVTDSLFDDTRARLQQWAYEIDRRTGEVAPGRYRLVEWVPPKGGMRTIMLLTRLRGKAVDGLTCPFCVGVWASAVVVALLVWFGALPGGRWWAIWIPAVAGAQALLSSIDGKLNDIGEK